MQTAVNIFTPKHLERYAEIMRSLIGESRFGLPLDRLAVYLESIKNQTTDTPHYNQATGQYREAYPFSAYNGYLRKDERRGPGGGYLSTLSLSVQSPMTGVFNPMSLSVEWKQGHVEHLWSSGKDRVACPVPQSGCFNPLTGKIEWKPGESNGGYGLGHTGVFNPIARKIEWKRSEPGLLYWGRVHGQPYQGHFDALRERVEWKLLT